MPPALRKESENVAHVFYQKLLNIKRRLSAGWRKTQSTDGSFLFPFSIHAPYIYIYVEKKGEGKKYI